MSLAHVVILINELFHKDPDMVTEKDTLSIVDSKSEVCMAKDGKDSKNTNNISIRVHFVGNGEKFKMHKID